MSCKYPITRGMVFSTDNFKVIEFIQGITLFSGQASEQGTWTAEDDQLARMSEILGPFPPHFIKKGKRAAYFFDEKGIFYSIKVHSYRSIILMWTGARKHSSSP